MIRRGIRQLSYKFNISTRDVSIKINHLTTKMCTVTCKLQFLLLSIALYCEMCCRSLKLTLGANTTNQIVYSKTASQACGCPLSRQTVWFRIYPINSPIFLLSDCSFCMSAACRLTSIVNFWMEVGMKRPFESSWRIFICSKLSKNATQLSFQQIFPVRPIKNEDPYREY